MSEAAAARVKRAPPKSINCRTKYDIYITNGQGVGAQFDRCRKLLVDEDYPAVFLHGLGPACHIALTLALKLQQQCAYLRLAVEVYTDTVKLTDELLDEFGDLNISPSNRNRQNSALHIYC